MVAPRAAGRLLPQSLRVTRSRSRAVIGGGSDFPDINNASRVGCVR